MSESVETGLIIGRINFDETVFQNRSSTEFCHFMAVCTVYTSLHNIYEAPYKKVEAGRTDFRKDTDCVETYLSREEVGD